MGWWGARTGMSVVDTFCVALLLVPLLVLAMTGNWWGVSPLKPVLPQLWIPFGLAAIVQFGFGLLFHGRVLLNLLRLRIDLQALVVIGGAAALAVAALEYRRFDPGPGDTNQLLIIWRDAVFGASIVAIALMGEIGRQNALKRSPQVAQPAARGRITLEPGAFIRSDGIVVDGVSEIQDPIGTDDVFPIVVKAGMRVHAGGRNGDGALTIDIQDRPPAVGQVMRKIGPDGLEQIVAWIARTMLLAALGVAAWRFFHAPGNHDPLIDALRVLAMSTPLAAGLVMTAPAAELLHAARRIGIEIRDLAVLDRVRHVGAVILGHRGVLVPDRLRVITAHCVEGVSGTDLIRRVAAVAQLGHDPWGKAVLEFGVSFRMRLKDGKGYQSTPGAGMLAWIEGQQILCGTQRFIESHGVSCTPLKAEADKATAQGRRLRWIAEMIPSKRLIGLIVFGAPSVAGAAETVRNLNGLGLQTVWLARPDDPAHVALAKHLKIGRIVSDKSEEVTGHLAGLRKKEGPLLVVTADAVPEGLQRGDVVLPFGHRIMDQLPQAALATARHDPRLVVDLISLANRHRQVVLLNAAIAFLSAAVLAFTPAKMLGYHSDLASYEVGIVLLIALSSLGLRATPTTANEVDEE